MREQTIGPAQQSIDDDRRAADQPRKPYRVAQVAAALDVHPSTIYRDIETGKLRAHRVGTGRGALRIPHWAWQEYLSQLEADARIAAAEGAA